MAVGPRPDPGRRRSTQAPSYRTVRGFQSWRSPRDCSVTPRARVRARGYTLRRSRFAGRPGAASCFGSALESDPRDRDARPSLDEVLAVRRKRRAMVRDVIAALMPEQVASGVTRTAQPQTEHNDSVESGVVRLLVLDERPQSSCRDAAKIVGRRAGNFDGTGRSAVPRKSATKRADRVTMAITARRSRPRDTEIRTGLAGDPPTGGVRRKSFTGARSTAHMGALVARLCA